MISYILAEILVLGIWLTRFQSFLASQHIITENNFSDFVKIAHLLTEIYNIKWYNVGLQEVFNTKAYYYLKNILSIFKLYTSEIERYFRLKVSHKHWGPDIRYLGV